MFSLQSTRIARQTPPPPNRAGALQQEILDSPLVLCRYRGFTLSITLNNISKLFLKFQWATCNVRHIENPKQNQRKNELANVLRSQILEVMTLRLFLLILNI